MKKTCAKCFTEKPDTEFHKSARAKDRLSSYCKLCAKEQVKLWKMANTEKRKINQENYYRKHKEKLNEKRKAYRKVKPELQAKYAKRHRLRKLYGMTPASFDEKIRQQNNKCVICEAEFAGNKRPVIDHCHTTGIPEIFCVPHVTPVLVVLKGGILGIGLAILGKA
jgi:hypothetical protein